MNFKKAWPFFASQFIAVAPFSITNLVMPVLLAGPLGLSATEIGFILAVSSIIRAFISPILGAISDIIQKPRLVLILAISVTIFSLVFLFPSISNVVDGTVAYVLFFAGAGLYMPTIDRASNEFAQHSNVSYGKIRIFGSIGYTIFGMIAPMFLGASMETAALIMTGMLMACLIPVAFFIPFETVEPSEHAFFAQLKILSKDLTVFVPILAYVLIVSAASNIQYFYVGSVLTAYGAVGLISVAVFLASFVSEVPSFLSYRKFAHKYGSANLIKYIVIITIARFVLLFFWHGPVIYALTLVLHGITFAFTWNFTLDFIIDNVSPHLRTTVMTVMGSLIMITGGISQAVGAQLLTSSNPANFFLWLLAVTLVAGALYLWIFKKRPEMIKR